MGLDGRETEFEQVVSDIYQTALDRSGWERTLVRASDFVGAIGGLLAFHDLSAPDSARNWTHLRRCFDRTGTRSQVDLARLLALFPAGARR